MSINRENEKVPEQGTPVLEESESSANTQGENKSTEGSTVSDAPTWKNKLNGLLNTPKIKNDNFEHQQVVKNKDSDYSEVTDSPIKENSVNKSIIERLKLAFPWEQKSNWNGSLENNERQEEEQTDHFHEMSVNNQYEQEKVKINDDCCSELCSEVFGNIHDIAKQAKMLSKEATEFTKEAEQLNKQARDIVNFCDVPVKEGAGILPTIIGAVSQRTFSETELPHEDFQSCVYDFSTATNEANKLVQKLEDAKILAINTKELTEIAMCKDGVLTDEVKNTQKSLLSHLKRSEDAIKATNKLIEDSNNIATGIVSNNKSLIGKFQKYHFQEIGIFSSGVAFGVCCGYLIGYAFKHKVNVTGTRVKLSKNSKTK